MKQSAVLEINNLTISLRNGSSVHPIVKDVSLRVQHGSVVCLVGESGAGKSLLAKAIFGLLDKRQFGIEGTIYFNGMNLLGLSEKMLRQIRGQEMAMVFQDPASALNPVLTVGRQIRELYTTHLGYSQARAKADALVMLAKAGLPDPHKIWHQYPFQLSGGMRQRVMIAMAMALSPAIIVADEPTTALDVTLQAQVLRELKSLQRETGMSLLLITHNMGVVAEIADQVAVMKQGEIIEFADCLQIFERPQQSYTKSLLKAAQLKKEEELRGERPASCS